MKTKEKLSRLDLKFSPAASVSSTYHVRTLFTRTSILAKDNELKTYRAKNNNNKMDHFQTAFISS